MPPTSSQVCWSRDFVCWQSFVTVRTRSKFMTEMALFSEPTSSFQEKSTISLFFEMTKYFFYWRFLFQDFNSALVSKQFLAGESWIIFVSNQDSMFRDFCDNSSFPKIAWHQDTDLLSRDVDWLSRGCHSHSQDSRNVWVPLQTEFRSKMCRREVFFLDTRLAVFFRTDTCELRAFQAFQRRSVKLDG